MLSGENVIITQAQKAKENTRGGEVREIVNMAVTKNEAADYVKEDKKTKQDVVDELHSDGSHTCPDVKIVEGRAYYFEEHGIG